MDSGKLSLLRLLHLADSALPIGATSHSFGLETLAHEGVLTRDNLEDFLDALLEESGTLEVVYCREAWILARTGFDRGHWHRLNDRLSAMRLPRESRKASLMLGRRFLQLAAALDRFPFDFPLDDDAHLCAAFGLTAGCLAIPADRAALGYLHQTMSGLLAACQRMMPVGQTHAARILWNLKPRIASIVEESALLTVDNVSCFQPNADLASTRHPGLHTRLFVS